MKKRSRSIRLDICKIILTLNFVIRSHRKGLNVILFVQLSLACSKSLEFSDLRLILVEQGQNSVPCLLSRCLTSSFDSFVIVVLIVGVV